jgi:diacylglycerol kinase (ATP)
VSDSTLVIFNPSSRTGATGRRASEIEAGLRRALGPVEMVWTRAPRDAEEIARKAAEAGVERLVVAGGDGTASEVASGLLASGRASQVELGLLPLGTGGDLARTLGLPRKLDAATQQLGSGGRRRIDAGRVSFLDPDGEPAHAHFLNVGSFGLSGLTDLYVKDSPRLFGGGVAFAIAAIRSILSFQPADVEVRVDGETVHSGPLNLAACANGRYFGGGMRIAPAAEPTSGRFEVVVVADLSRAELIWNLPRLFRGTHLSLPAVSVHKGIEVEAIAEPGRMLLDIDGEPLGSLPARFTILPGAITLFGVASDSS